eukprot:TRINITY_DN81579_c0_g1_i1.p1 TRINITY_DN81579_c0_g1~~TRINITY_DN81579_c0_g1_i1.p1  ORF type:complete len:850 (-),score=260.43 TRINITY_DN81579_c0_g1_i1:223-2508(-)
MGVGGPVSTAMGGSGAPGEVARPMTSNRRAGFSRAGRPTFDPLKQGALLGPAPPLERRAERSPEEVASDMEKSVHSLLEESSEYLVKGELQHSLESAKEAAKKERAMCKFRDQQGLLDQINVDLTCSIAFNVSAQHEANGHFSEALQTYSLLVKEKQYAYSSRIRVNMGNIYFRQKKFSQAIKMYRMALDEVPPEYASVRFKVMKNIGNTYVQMKQYQDAMRVFEEIMQQEPDIQTGMNLVLCTYALGDRDGMKRSFTRMLSVEPPSYLMGDEDEMESSSFIFHGDSLREELRKKEMKMVRYILRAAKLIAPKIGLGWEEGYGYIIEQLKEYDLNPRYDLSSEIDMARALELMKRKEFGRAVESLKAFEKKDDRYRTGASTNLSFLYFLEGDYVNAERYAQLATQADKYNAKAMVNEGNCHFVQGRLEDAERLYLNAMELEADCVEAVYNFGLCCKRRKSFERALNAFQKLHHIVPESVEVVYHIADLHEAVGKDPGALEWFGRMIGKIPTDTRALARLGVLHSKSGDDAQALHYHLESYRYLPVEMNVISWLGVYFVKNSMFERAMMYLQRAAEIQPQEEKWQLMVASCHRRVGNFQKAKRLYQRVHAADPDNVECMRYLVQICRDLGDNDEAAMYHKMLMEASSRAETRRQQEAKAESGVGMRPTRGGSRGGGEMGYDSMESSGGSSGGGLDSMNGTAGMSTPMGSRGTPTKTPSRGGSAASKPSSREESRKDVSSSRPTPPVEDDEWGDDVDDALLPM